MTKDTARSTTSSLAAGLEATYRGLLDRVTRDPVATRLLHGPFDGLDTYVRLLKQSYHYVCRTSPWLARASQLAADPLVAQLLARKAEEERGHEGWILSDLQALGFDVSEPGRWPVAPAVAAYLAWHDFAIEEQAEAVLGAAYVLERLSECASGVATRLAVAGVPPGGFSFMRGHAEVDVTHVRELRQVLHVVTDERAVAHVRLSGQVTAAAYLGLLRSLGAPALAST